MVLVGCEFGDDGLGVLEVCCWVVVVFRWDGLFDWWSNWVVGCGPLLLGAVGSVEEDEEVEQDEFECRGDT